MTLNVPSRMGLAAAVCDTRLAIARFSTTSMLLLSRNDFCSPQFRGSLRGSVLISEMGSLPPPCASHIVPTENQRQFRLLRVGRSTLAGHIAALPASTRVDHWLALDLALTSGRYQVLYPYALHCWLLRRVMHGMEPW